MPEFRTTFFILSTIALLSACATPDQMRTSSPSSAYTSGKTAKSVSLCIAKRWENSGYGGTPAVTFRPTETGFTVAVRNEVLGSTQLLADIAENAAGSKTYYFKGAVLGEGEFDKAVRECQ